MPAAPCSARRPELRAQMKREGEGSGCCCFMTSGGPRGPRPMINQLTTGGNAQQAPERFQ